MSSELEPLGGAFRRMALWKKAQDFAEEVAELVVRLPRDRATDVLAAQLLRASASIAANVAEGYGRYSQPAYRNHLSIARGSACEAVSWLDLLSRRGYIASEAEAQLLGHCDEIQRLLTVKMKSLGDAKKTYAREAGTEYEV